MGVLVYRESQKKKKKNLCGIQYANKTNIFLDKDIIIKTLSTHWHLIQIGTKYQSSANTFIQFGTNF